MQFSFLTKMTAFALLATGAVAAEEPKTNKLRGPVVVSLSDIEAQAATSDVKVSHSSHRARPSAAGNKDLPKFFPSDMTPEQVAVFKETAAQKRQNKRDNKREDDNPDRTQSEENRERERKTEQSRSRGDTSVDPYNDNGDEYGRKREAGRAARCDRRGSGCEYSTPNGNCYRDCTDEGYSSRNFAGCSEFCKYMDPLCYDDCRRTDSIVDCLDECGENISSRSGDRAADRIDCAEDALDCGRVGSNAYQKCFDRCESSIDGGSRRNDRNDRRSSARNTVDCADDFCRNKGGPGDRRFENCMDDNCRSSGDRTINGQSNCREEFCDNKGRPGDKSFERCMDKNCRDAAY